jgi:ferredoxin
VCVPECPENAIFAEDDVPEDQKAFTQINAELAKLWKPLVKSKESMPDLKNGLVLPINYSI